MADEKEKDENKIDKLDVRLNWFDRTIGFFSPRALLKRKRAKIWDEHLSRKYEGADAGRRTKGWNTGSSSANTEIATGLPRLRNRSRDMVRNNPYAARGVQVIQNNVVGRGILTQLKVDDDTKKNRREKRLNNIWRAWANTPAIDYDGVHTIAGLQSLIMRSIVESGEVIIRLRRTGRRFVVGPDGVEVEVPPIQLQVLESDFIASTRSNSKTPEGNRIIQGIEINPNGKKEAYHLFADHPGSLDISLSSKFSTVRIPANQILHPFRVDRPGQLRGVPWLNAVMLRLRDFDIYEDAQLKRQQCAAMYTAFVHDSTGYDSAEEAKAEIELGEKMEPGVIELLPPGKEITLSKPPGADNYEEYTSVVLHSIASGLGITFEALTNNLKEVNFSSARMGFLEMQRNIDTWRASLMINMFMRPVFDWFKNSLPLIGESEKAVRANFTSPRREMIDPTKEIPALKNAVRSGFKTLSSVVSEFGEEPDNHFEALKQDNETLDSLKLILDSDPRRLDNSGSSNEKTEGQDNAD